MTGMFGPSSPLMAVLGLLVALLAVAIIYLLLQIIRGRHGFFGRAQQLVVVDQLASLRQDLADRLDRSRQHTESQLRDSRQEMHRHITDLTQHVNQRLIDMNTQLGQQLTENRKQIGQSSKQLFERLEASGKLFAQINQQFGQLQESSKRLADLGADIGKLQQILVPSMGRGRFGEEQLEELLRNVLTQDGFQMQHTFKDGQKVDAVVRLAHGLVGIDSKFPKPAFDRFVAAEGTDARKTAFREFVRDCRRHVDSVSSKYIRPDEGTLDFALMWIPAENIYYHTILVDEKLDQTQSIAQYAREKRVFCVSPNTLLAYLHVILIGLKGLRVEKCASAILAVLSRISDEFNLFAEDFRLVGTHIDRARSKFSDAERRLEKVSEKFDETTRLSQDEHGDSQTSRIATEMPQPATTFLGSRG